MSPSRSSGGRRKRSALTGRFVTEQHAPMPRRIKMGPLTYRVSTSTADWKRIAPDEFEDSWGYTHHPSGTILITPDAHPDLQRLTLVHEILHAAAFAGGQLDDRKRDEEAWVVMTAAPLADALARTKGLAEYLAGR